MYIRVLPLTQHLTENSLKLKFLTVSSDFFLALIQEGIQLRGIQKNASNCEGGMLTLGDHISIGHFCYLAMWHVPCRYVLQQCTLQRVHFCDQWKKLHRLVRLPNFKEEATAVELVANILICRVSHFYFQSTSQGSSQQYCIKHNNTPRNPILEKTSTKQKISINFNSSNK